MPEEDQEEVKEEDESDSEEAKLRRWAKEGAMRILGPEEADIAREVEKVRKLELEGAREEADTKMSGAT